MQARLHAQPPVFDLHTAAGVTTSGPVERISEDWSIKLGGATPSSVQGNDLVTMRRSLAVLPAFPSEEQVIFSNGDRLPGSAVLQGASDRLVIQAQVGSGQELILPLTAVSVLWFATPDGVDDAPAFRRRLAGERRRRDVVLLRNGDSLEGDLATLEKNMVSLRLANGKEIRKIERDKVAAVALNTALARVPRQRGIYAVAVLSNGGRLSLASAHSEEKNLVGKTIFGGTIRIPLEQVVALDLRQGRAVYLSDLKASGYQHTPFLGVHWQYLRDSSVAGRDLLLGGSTYDKGLGLHSESRLSYDLNAGYQWFETTVGLDDQSGRRGSVVLQVLVDGRPQDCGGVKELTGGDKPRSLRIPVTGGRELTLVVKFGSGGDVQDHVDWADARIIK